MHKGIRLIKRNHKEQELDGLACSGKHLVPLAGTGSQQRSPLLTQRSEAPSRAGITAALTTRVATATLTHAGTGNAAPG